MTLIPLYPTQTDLQRTAAITADKHKLYEFAKAVLRHYEYELKTAGGDMVTAYEETVKELTETLNI